MHYLRPETVVPFSCRKLKQLMEEMPKSSTCGSTGDFEHFPESAREADPKSRIVETS